MKEANFILSKIQQYLNDFDSMNEQEKADSMHFVLNVQKHQLQEALKLINRTQELNESLHLENEELKEDVQFYQSFIQDNNLGKRYQFYCKQKGVI